MDILQLIDRLEELFNESKSIPLTRNVMVDEDWRSAFSKRVDRQISSMYAKALETAGSIP